MLRAKFYRDEHHMHVCPNGWERKAGCTECLQEAPNRGKLEWGWLSVGSQLHHITCVHPPPEWAGLSLPLLILAAAVIFLHRQLPTFSAAATEEKLVSEKWRVQDLCSALRLWVMLKGGTERKVEILGLPHSEVGTKKWGASSSSGLIGVGITTESVTRCFKPSLAAAVTHLSGVLVGRQGCSAAQEGSTAQFISSRDRLLARRSISSWIQQTRPPAGPHG